MNSSISFAYATVTNEDTPGKTTLQIIFTKKLQNDPIIKLFKINKTKLIVIH